MFSLDVGGLRISVVPWVPVSITLAICFLPWVSFCVFDIALILGFE